MDHNVSVLETVVWLMKYRVAKETQKRSQQFSSTPNTSSVQHARSKYESSIFYANADSSLNKRGAFKTLKSANKYKSAVITKALPKNRINSIVNEIAFHIKGYRMSNTALNHEEGRGIIMYVKKYIIATALQLLFKYLIYKRYWYIVTTKK